MKQQIISTRDVARELARKYSTMTHDELDALEGILIPMHYQKGKKILTAGEVCKNIYYIHSGLIRQFYKKNGKEVTEHLGTDNSIFMSIQSLFDEVPTQQEVMALENTYIFAIPKRELEQIALHNNNIQILYRKILEESLILSQVHADLVRFETAHDRYVRFCKIMPQVALRAPLVFIASYLQMTPETLSRVRAQPM